MPSRLLALLMLVGAVATTAAQTPSVLAPSGRWVTDAGDLLSEPEERLLSQRVASFADTTSTQIVVVTVASLGGAAPVDYAVELGRSWGVGQQGRDNGIVILVSRDDREVFIATGFGLEGAVPDAVASRIVRRLVIPRFREGLFYEGLSDAVDALMLASTGEFEAIAADDGPVLDMRMIALAFIVLVILLIVISSARQGGSGGGSGRTRYRSHRGPVIIWGSPGHGHRHGGLGGGFGGGFGGGGFGGFGGGGGSFGGGGAGGSW